MAPAPAFERYSPDPTLTPSQHHVLSLLAEGYSLTHAAGAVGVHRNTIRNWRRSVPAFAREIEFAVREQALVWHEQSVELAPRAVQVLSEILDSPDTSAAIRLRAALEILKMAAAPAPSIAGLPAITAEMDAAHGQLLSWQPQIVHNDQSENHAQSCTTAPIRKAPEPGRNTPCPCGSGQKWKRCCGRVQTTAQSAAA